MTAINIFITIKLAKMNQRMKKAAPIQAVLYWMS
jgi:hypothetical protein